MDQNATTGPESGSASGPAIGGGDENVTGESETATPEAVDPDPVDDANPDTNGVG